MNDINAEILMERVSALKTKDITYIDAVIEYAQSEGIEMELIAQVIRQSSILKAKIREDAEKLNMVEKKEDRLKIDI